MFALLALALFAVANGYVSENDFIPSHVDYMGGYTHLGHNRMWGSPLTHHAGLMGGFTGRTFGHPMTTFGAGFTDIHMVKTKLIQGIPCDINDFFTVKHTLPYVPQEELDVIEEIIKKKFTFGMPEIEIHRFEAAILKECVKVKVERGLPIDKLGSAILREAIKAKIVRGDPVDEKEAKICANNIKNKLVKGRPIDQLDAEVLLDFVKNKVSRREPITNLEAELCLELLKLKAITGEPLDTVEAEIVVDCVRNKARRGSPLDHLEEDLLITVVQNKELIHRVGNRALELAVEVMKNKEKRGEPAMATMIQTPVIPHEVKQPISLLDRTNFDDKIRFMHKSQMRPYGVRSLHTTGFGMNRWNVPFGRLHTTGFGLNRWNGPFTGLHTTGFGLNRWNVPFGGLNTITLGSTWNRCPVTGLSFHDVVGTGMTRTPFNVMGMGLRYPSTFTTPFNRMGLTTPFNRMGTWGSVLPTWNLV
jgi:hypothetical protein